MSRVEPSVYPRVSAQELAYQLLSRLGMQLGIAVDRADMIDLFPESPAFDGVGEELNDSLGDDGGESSRLPIQWLRSGAREAGILLQPVTDFRSGDVSSLLKEGHPLVVSTPESGLILVESIQSGTLHGAVFEQRAETRTWSRRQFERLLRSDERIEVMIAKPRFELDGVSATPFHRERYHDHESPTPLRRFLGLLRLEAADLWMVVLFAFVASVLALATPLAVESLVNVVSWGTYLQPVVVLGTILLFCLGLAGILRVLQVVIVELIQRRQFVRIVSDLAHRFPRATSSSLQGKYPRELANRVFDIMTVQKATSVLLLDGVTIVLTTFLGMMLLAFYHPFLLGFDLALLLAMITITWGLGRGGIRTAIAESVTKYRVAHWLQDVIDQPSVFKIGGGETLAIERANRLTADYIDARKQQFNVVLRQTIFAVGLHAVASTVLLALGGWLVIRGQLTLGQLVASELVVTIVVGAFAKAGKSLEKFYDLMAGVDKLGYLIDIEAETKHSVTSIPAGPASVRWSELKLQRPTFSCRIPAATIEPAERIAVVDREANGGSELAALLCGLRRASSGSVRIAGLENTNAGFSCEGRLVGYAGGNDVFRGMLRENVDLARSAITQDHVRAALRGVGLEKTLQRLADGMRTVLQTGGAPLSHSQISQLMIARAIVARPRLLVVDGLMDELGDTARRIVWETISAPDAPWTLIVVTRRDDIAALCSRRICVESEESVDD